MIQSHKVSGSVLQLNNDVVNIINISMGSIIAVLMQQLLLQKWFMWICCHLSLDIRHL